MSENIQNQDEISLFEIFKILWSKVKLIALILAVGVLAGAGLGLIKNIGKKNYGVTIAYYVNPYKDPDDPELPIYGSYGTAITDTVKELLGTELFASLILEGMTGEWAAPEKYLETDTNGRKPINPEYAEALYKVQESILVEESDGLNVNNIFYVTISVPGEQTYAEQLRDRLNIVLPAFLEKNMPTPGDYIGTKCQPLTIVDEVTVLNDGQMIKDMLKFGVLIGAATFVIGCVVVVIKERYTAINGQKTEEETAEEI